MCANISESKKIGYCNFYFGVLYLFIKRTT